METAHEMNFNSITKQERSFSIPYSKQDMYINYTKFKQCLGESRHLKGKKLRRVVKRYKWYDYGYFSFYLFDYYKKTNKVAYRHFDEVYNDAIEESMRHYIVMGEKKFSTWYEDKLNVLENHLLFLFTYMRKNDPTYLKGFQYYMQYLISKYYYFGVAADADTERMCSAMYEFVVALQSDNLDDAAHIYAHKHMDWWD